MLPKLEENAQFSNESYDELTFVNSIQNPIYGLIDLDLSWSFVWTLKTEFWKTFFENWIVVFFKKTDFCRTARTASLKTEFLIFTLQNFITYFFSYL